MRHRSPTLLIMALVVCASPLAAQSGGGSSYSIFNIGDIRIGTTATGIARGGTEGVMPMTRTVSSYNPALWGDLDNVTVQAGVLFSQNRVSDESGSIAQNRTAISDLAAGFPISQEFRSGIAVGLHPYSTVSYRTRLTDDAPTVGGDTAKAEMDFSGSGGVSEIFMGGSFAPIPMVTIGVAGAHLIGAIDNQTGVTFPGKELNNAVYIRNDLLSGWGFRVGATVRPTEAISISGVFESPVDLERERHSVAAYLDQGTQVVDTTGVTTSTLSIPARFTLGASLHTGRFLVGAQGTFQSWDKTDFQTTRTSMRLGAGGDRLGSTSSGSSGIDRWNLRFGAYYDQTYYEVGGTGIDEMGITLGLGIPLTMTTRLDVGTTLDLAFELGRRGTTDSGLTEEMFGRVMVQLSVSELWFVRSRR